MPCDVIMDLKPAAAAFSVSKAQKSAILPCVFSGNYKGGHTIDIDLLLTRRAGAGPLRDQISEIEEKIKEGALLRVNGKLRRLVYQDRNSGEEVSKLQLYAYNVSISPEDQPVYSTVLIEGGVRKLSDTEIFKDLGSYRKVAFMLFSDPETNMERETYLTLYCTGYDAVADRINKLKLREKSHVIVSGKLEATAFGMLGLRIFDLHFANSKPHDTRKENQYDTKNDKSGSSRC